MAEDVSRAEVAQDVSQVEVAGALLATAARQLLDPVLDIWQAVKGSRGHTHTHQRILFISDVHSGFNENSLSRESQCYYVSIQLDIVP